MSLNRLAVTDLSLFAATVCLVLLAPACATYYQKNIGFHEAFVKGDVEEAARILEKDKGAAKDRNRLLFFLQKGVVLQMLRDYPGSNDFFEQAYLFTEDVQRNYGAEALGLLSNPQVTPYRGEDFEVVQIHYYKALNHLFQGRYEEAQVECRRIDIKLNQFNDRYEKRKNRYKRDAFARNLMGIIFEAAGDVNNAFVSYRNAYEAYQEDYGPNFGVPTPLQLKKDLLRTAYLNGFSDELQKYQSLFGMTHEPRESPGGELVFFWNNGLGPVKDEWSVNFFIVRGRGGLVTFVNEELKLALPFPLGGSGSGSTDLGDLKFVRVAFPKYLVRKPYYRTAELVAGGKTFPLETGQDLNEIALKTLEDRMIRELAKSLLRLAVKQAAEQAVRNKNENLGALLSIAQAISEKADTRNWQTLPYSISYARVPLPAGQSTVSFKAWSPKESQVYTSDFQFDGQPGVSQFYLFHNLESLPLGQ